jgi:hypothetical protein
MQKNQQDELVPDPVVWREFGVTSMTLHRWTNDEKLNFPPPVKIRTKNFRSRRALEEFKERMTREAITKRAEAK